MLQGSEPTLMRREILLHRETIPWDLTLPPLGMLRRGPA